MGSNLRYLILAAMEFDLFHAIHEEFLWKADLSSILTETKPLVKGKYFAILFYNMNVFMLYLQNIIKIIHVQKICLEKFSTCPIVMIADQKTPRNAKALFCIVIRPSNRTKRNIPGFGNHNKKRLCIIHTISVIPRTLLRLIEHKGLVDKLIVLRIISPCDDVWKIFFFNLFQIRKFPLNIYPHKLPHLLILPSSLFPCTTQYSLVVLHCPHLREQFFLRAHIHIKNINVIA